LNFENFIDDFIDTKINVTTVKFNHTSPHVREQFEKLKIEECKTSDSVDLSIEIIQSVIKNYSSYICLQTVSHMLRNDLFSDMPELKKELFLKKIAWFMYTMYEVEGKSCGWQYYDDAGIVRNIVSSFKESIEKQYSQKIDEWDINQ
jgi:hypothetical protein